MTSTLNPARRAFLQRSAQLSLAGTALPFALNLATIGEAAAFNAPGGDYKALVCVFLFGGNDYANTVVPYDNPSYDLYSTIRGGGAARSAGGIALAQADLTATLLNPATALPGGRQYALHPSLAGVAGLFNSGKAAVQLNVGPLVKPLSRAQYAGTDRVNYPLPPQLFSHNDQQSVWQAAAAEGATEGWGGHLGDLAIANSLNPQASFSCISVTGNAVLLSGNKALQYQVSTSGAIKIRPATATSVAGSTSYPPALKALLQASSPSGHVLENAYNAVTARSMAREVDVSTAMTSGALSTTFQADSLSQQLKTVAQLIKGRASLGNPRRQVFMVSMGGFDTHDDLIKNHGPLLQNLNNALTAFYAATQELGVEKSVTSFTASDFGRTLTSNGDGSDHGWGSHHFVVGGAVNGGSATKGNFYGYAPPVSVGNTQDGSGNYVAEDQWHVGQGRLLPSTSVDQYAATLAKWFGVTDAEMPSVLPNINNFGISANGISYPKDLGFM